MIKAKRAAAVVKKEEVVTGPRYHIMDGGTGQNLAISLSSLRIKVDALVEKIVNNEKSLPTSIISVLANKLPPPTELASYGDLDVPEEQMMDPEKLFKKVI